MSMQGTTVLEVEHLAKTYPSFHLDDVSLRLEAGRIMGFIGRNGAGKTTTLKSILNLVHPDAGTIRFFGMDLGQNEDVIKQRIGFTAGGTGYYTHRRLRDITKVTKSFYENWDDAVCRRYMERFQLDEQKKPLELSEGMKVKYYLCMALSHHAEVLLLDEPTSGLDPVSRDELLDIFMDLAAEGTAILFSTHITSDLEKCADDITYIQNGKILASTDMKIFSDRYRLVQLGQAGSAGAPGAAGAEAGTQAAGAPGAILSVRRSKAGNTALIRTADAGLFPAGAVSVPDLQTVMVHLEKEELQ